MEQLETIEQDFTNQPYLTMGDMPIEEKGKYHVDDVEKFKEEGLLAQLAYANSKLSSDESTTIVLKNNFTAPSYTKGKTYHYIVFGIDCLAFEELTTPYVEIYIESSKKLSAIIKNKEN